MAIQTYFIQSGIDGLISENACPIFQVQSVLQAAEDLVNNFSAMQDECHEMWTQLAAAFMRNDGKPCPWPHIRAFDANVRVLERQLTLYRQEREAAS